MRLINVDRLIANRFIPTVRMVRAWFADCIISENLFLGSTQESTVVGATCPSNDSSHVVFSNVVEAEFSGSFTYLA